MQETAIVKAGMPETDRDVSALESRIAALEAKLKNLSALPRTEISAPSAAPKVRLEVIEEESPSFDTPFTAEEPPADLFSARKPAAESVNALAEDKRKNAFGYFMRTLRTSSRNGVLFTMCQDLEHAFEGDKFVLTAKNEVIYRSLSREQHRKTIGEALEKIGMQGQKIDGFEEDVARLKSAFPNTDIEER